MENIGENFQEDLFLKARTKAWELCYQVAAQAEMGMAETDLQNILETLSESVGVEKWWHPIKVRFGENTRCSFRDPSNPEVTLKDCDIFFLDIGPVFNGHEGDVGQTFKLSQGKIEETYQNPAEVLFHQLNEIWKTENLTGEALYQKALELASLQGLEFNLRMAGHRLSEFPHALHHKGPLKEFQDRPSPQRWVLEVHLLERKKDWGYFYEDLLL